jgi:hypothetical protein
MHGALHNKSSGCGHQCKFVNPGARECRHCGMHGALQHRDFRGVRPPTWYCTSCPLGPCTSTPNAAAHMALISFISTSACVRRCATSAVAASVPAVEPALAARTAAGQGQRGHACMQAAAGLPHATAGAEHARIAQGRPSWASAAVEQKGNIRHATGVCRGEKRGAMHVACACAPSLRLAACSMCTMPCHRSTSAIASGSGCCAAPPPVERRLLTCVGEAPCVKPERSSLTCRHRLPAPPKTSHAG